MRDTLRGWGEAAFTLPFRRRQVTRQVDRKHACLLIDGTSGLALSQHPTIESAVQAAKKVAAHRAARKLAPLALKIVAR